MALKLSDTGEIQGRIVRLTLLRTTIGIGDKGDFGTVAQIAPFGSASYLLTYEGDPTVFTVVPSRSVHAITFSTEEPLDGNK